MERPHRATGLAQGLKSLMLLAGYGALDVRELAALAYLDMCGARAVLETFEEHGFARRIAASNRFEATGLTLRLSGSGCACSRLHPAFIHGAVRQGIRDRMVFH
jgi:DNA-binding IclR family transcriptional regulator